MNEKIFLLEHVNLNDFWGVNHTNFQVIKDLNPKLHLVNRGNQLKVSGSEEDVQRFTNRFEQIECFYQQNNYINEDIIKNILLEVPQSLPHTKDTILMGAKGNPITARTPNQRRLAEAYKKNDLLFAIGPAGSGKTYTAIALAVNALKNKEVKKIILSRPAVEAGENLGFLPGDLKEKIAPYLQPLYDALQDMIPGARLENMMQENIIQIAPLAYMRGRTLSHAVVILDEAQNTSENQLKMFLTRMGRNTKMIVTGDITQIDLPGKQRSGLIQAEKILKDIKGIKHIYFDVKDIVRHPLVQEIVLAYDKNTSHS